MIESVQERQHVKRKEKKDTNVKKEKMDRNMRTMEKCIMMHIHLYVYKCAMGENLSNQLYWKNAP